MKFRGFNGNALLLLFDGDRASACDSCAFVFRRYHVWSEKPVRTCPACGTTEYFRQATDDDLDAYVERTRARPLDYLKALALMIVIGGIVVIITKWVVDA